MTKLLISILVLFTCCVNKDSYQIYKFIDYKYDDYPAAVRTVSKNVSFKQKFEHDNFFLEYIFDNHYSPDDTLNFVFGNNNATYLSSASKDEKNSFILLSKKKYIINKKSIEIFKYALDPSAPDGCLLYFWTNEMGIIIIKSATWHNFRKLDSTNDDERDILLMHIQDILFQDVDFFNGC